MHVLPPWKHVTALAQVAMSVHVFIPVHVASLAEQVSTPAPLHV